MNCLLDLALLGLPLASRNDAYPVFLPAWGALINGAVALTGSRCFFTAQRALMDGTASSLAGAASIEAPSPHFQALFITVATMAQMPAALEALFLCLCSCKLHNHPQGKHYYYGLFCSLGQ